MLPAEAVDCAIVIESMAQGFGAIPLYLWIGMEVREVFLPNGK